MSEAVRESFRQQAAACAALGSPFMGRLLSLCAERLTDETRAGARILSWEGDTSGTGDAVALRLAGTLHAQVLSGTDPALAAAYPPNSTTDADLWSAVEAALARKETLRGLDSPPQTNEVRRSSGIVPALHLLSTTLGMPLALWEIGCSGGLNLRCDQFRVSAGASSYGPKGSPVVLEPGWTGPEVRPSPLTIAERRGVDLNPLDPSTPDDALRLRAYLWPDQSDRLQRTEAAIAIARANPARVDRGDAVDWLRHTLPDHPAGTVLFHTIAWQYLPQAAKADGEALIAQAGNKATRARPLARLSMEPAPGAAAALTVTVWPDGRTWPLARMDYHGRWVHWTGPTGPLPFWTETGDRSWRKTLRSMCSAPTSFPVRSIR